VSAIGNENEIVIGNVNVNVIEIVNVNEIESRDHDAVQTNIIDHRIETATAEIAQETVATLSTTEALVVV
jgi:hypothetical protein